MSAISQMANQWASEEIKAANEEIAELRGHLAYWKGFAQSRMGEMDSEDLARYEQLIAIVKGVK